LPGVVLGTVHAKSFQEEVTRTCLKSANHAVSICGTSQRDQILVAATTNGYFKLVPTTCHRKYVVPENIHTPTTEEFYASPTSPEFPFFEHKNTPLPLWNFHKFYVHPHTLWKK